MNSKDHSITDPQAAFAAAERVIVSCYYLASDLVDLARQSPLFDEHQMQFMARQLMNWAQRLSAAIEAARGDPAARD